jgi:hypothetical protein
MTSLVLGAAGGAIGFAIGGPVGAQVGFLAGSLIGNLLDPPKTQGPRLGDLKLQRSTYGSPIPYVWGKGRLAGNVWDQTDLEEHEEKSGGKGGPEVTNYTYSASLLIGLCARTPNRTSAILGITRIWANGRLIWDSENEGDDDTACPFTVYLGTEDQLPDPTFEAINGVGLQTAYRGMAYVVATDYDMTEFGKTIPQFEFEVYTNEGGDIPYIKYAWDTTAWCPPNHSPVTATCRNGIVTMSCHANVGPDPALFWIQYDLQGNLVSPMVTTILDAGVGIYVGNDHAYVTNGSGNEYCWFADDFGNFTKVSDYSFTPTGAYSYANENQLLGDPPLYQNGVMISCDSSASLDETRIQLSSAPGGVLRPGIFAAYIIPFYINYTDVAFGTSNTGDWYIAYRQDGSSDTWVWKFDKDLNLIHEWLPAQTAGTNLIGLAGKNFHVHNDVIVFPAVDGSSNPRVDLAKLTYPIATAYGIQCVATHGARIKSMGGGLGWCLDGIYCINPPSTYVLLSEIVADLSAMTPIGSAFDVTELTDQVGWFVMASQMAVRNAIDSLRKVYNFSAVESDDVVKFRKHGSASVVTVDDADLGVHEYGTEAGDLLVTVRKREQELARMVTLTFINIEADYQTGAVSSARQVTLSENDVTLEVSVGFTMEEAQQKVHAILATDWDERESFEWTTSRKYAQYEPCDVMTVRGRDIRVTTKHESPNGIIQWRGVQSSMGLFDQSQATGATGGGGTTTDPPGPKAATQLYFLDIPLISIDDSVYGFYVAMGPVDNGSWPGAQLFKSLDGGGSYSSAAVTSSPAFTGRTTVGTGSPLETGTLPNSGFTIGTVHETSILVRLDRTSYSLESCTSAALANGANLCAISIGGTGSPPNQNWEICQFRDAVLVTENVYRLTGFMRGLRGSDTTGHSDTDIFTLLPVLNVQAPESELNRTLTYKAVTYGTALADALPQDFQNTGRGRDSYGDDVLDIIPIFTGSGGSPSHAGTTGLVPPPAAGDAEEGKFLSAYGDWRIPYIDIQDEGAAQGSIKTFNVVGPGGSIAVAGTVATLTLPQPTILIGDEGSPATVYASTLVVEGAAANISVTSGVATLRVISDSYIVISPTFNVTMTVDVGPYSAYGAVVIYITLTNNFTFNLTNTKDGQVYRVYFIQDGTGGRVITIGANIRNSTGLPYPLLSTAANRIDAWGFQGSGIDNKAWFLAYVTGF